MDEAQSNKNQCAANSGLHETCSLAITRRVPASGHTSLVRPFMVEIGSSP